MLPMKFLKIFYLFSVLFFLTDTVFAKLVWQQEYSFDNTFNFLEAFVYSRSDDTFLTSVISQNLDNNQNSFWIWKLSQDGEKIWGKKLNNNLESKANGFKNGIGLQVLKTGEILVAALFEKNVLSIVKLDSSGNVLSSIDYPEDAKELVITGLVMIDDNNYFVFGSKNDDAWIIKLNVQNGRVWEKIYPREKVVYITSLILDGGGLIFSSNTGKFNKYLAGDSDVWVVKCDLDGNKISENIFKGRNASLCKNNNGYFILYDKSQVPANQQIASRYLNNSLIMVWDHEMLPLDVGIFGFKVLSINNGYLIAGALNGELVVYLLDKDGNKEKDLCGQKIDLGYVKEIFISKEKFLISGASFSYDENFRKIKSNIKIVKIEP